MVKKAKTKKQKSYNDFETDRKSFLGKLSSVSPALSDNDMIAILTHFWFTGESVLAYNDQISISTPIETAFKGAIPGSTLLNLLKNSNARSVKFSPSDESMKIRAASTNLNLAMLDTDDFVFEMPEENLGAIIDVSDIEQFLQGIKYCLKSVGSDNSVPDQLGVTLLSDGQYLNMYSTDDSALTHAWVKLKKGCRFDDRVILSKMFCDQLLKLWPKDRKDAKLEVSDDYALLSLKNGSKLFGKLIISQHPLDHARTIEEHIDAKASKRLVTIPSKFKGILDRAIIILGNSYEHMETKIQVYTDSGNVKRMRFKSESSYGKVADTLVIEDQHPDVEVKMNPKLLRAGYGLFEKMLITDKCAMMTKEGVRYLVSAYGE